MQEGLGNQNAWPRPLYLINRAAETCGANAENPVQAISNNLFY